METFHFLRPWWLLALLPLALLLYQWYRNESQRNAWRDQVDEDLLPHLVNGQSTPLGKAAVITPALLWLLAVTALAGPVWEKLPAQVFRGLQERVLIMDLSYSMNARDTKPSRLERAQQKLQDILKQSADSQTALIVYAAAPYVISPLTDDVETIKSMLPSLSTDVVPAQGSVTSAALLKGLELLRQSGSQQGSLWLLTDSEPDSAAMAAATEIKASGFRLHVVGIGSSEGAPIPAATGGFVKDSKGNIVIARLQQTALKELAAAAGGVYTAVSNSDTDIDRLFGADSSQSVSGVSDLERQADIWLERGPFIVLLLLPFAALSFRRGWL